MSDASVSYMNFVLLKIMVSNILPDPASAIVLILWFYRNQNLPDQTLRGSSLTEKIFAKKILGHKILFKTRNLVTKIS